MPALPLEGKVIVVIGGTTGLGFSAARAIIAAGGRVVVVGRKPESAAEAERVLCASSKSLVADAGDPTTASKAIQLAHQHFGGFDGIYHVAGGSGRSKGDGPLHQITNAGWDFTIVSNLTALFYSNRAAVEDWLKRGVSGAVLNMSSVLAFSPSVHHFATHAYAAAKSGVIGFTKSAAAYYAKNNIRFNAIAPSLVATPMSQRAQTNQAILDFVHTKQPLDGGRIGQPEDLDAAVVFLLSDGARFVTGQVLAVDGGWAVSEGQIRS